MQCHIQSLLQLRRENPSQLDKDIWTLKDKFLLGNFCLPTEVLGTGGDSSALSTLKKCFNCAAHGFCMQKEKTITYQ